MTRTLVAAILLSLGAPAFAHRLDEYLQATLISVEKDHVQAFLRLVPGVAVSPVVIWSIDTNGDGVISQTEQQAYAQRVLADLTLSMDAYRLEPRLVSVNFPSIQAMKEGLGEIQIEFTADLRDGGANRQLILENHHQSRISAYIVNSLVPNDKNIQITAQHRNENQSVYELSYVQARRWSRVPPLLSATGLLFFAALAGCCRFSRKPLAVTTFVTV